MLTKAEMLSKLKTIGLKREYKPYWEEGPKHDTILLECRKPATIIDGIMIGVNMDVYDDATIGVWTSRKQNANAIAKANGFKIRLLDGEADLFLPVDRADEFLHKMGAKVKKQMSAEAKAKGAARLSKAREASKKTVAAIP